MSHLFDKQNSNQKEELEAVENKLLEVRVNMDKLEKKFYVKEEMPEETFEKLMTGLRKEKADLLDTMKLCKPSISNLKEYFSAALTFSTKLPMAWASSEAKTKENFQKLLFPEGVYYNKQTGTFRTTKINLVFEVIATVKDISEGNKNKQGGVNSTLSMLVGMTGFEPAAPSSRTKCATGLRYIPKKKSLNKFNLSIPFIK